MIARLCPWVMLFSVMASAQPESKPYKRSDFLSMIRESQIFLARAMPFEAQQQLIIWDDTYPEVRRDPLFCYQRFFVALQGHGDRKTAKLMLDRMDALVESGELDPYLAEYQSVTEAWYRALQSADSDLPRLAHNIMAERLARNPEWADENYFKR